MSTICNRAFLFILCSIAFRLPAADAGVGPLWLYNGTWESSSKTAQGAAGHDKLSNECGTIGKFFGCQQTVNGKLSALVLFIPSEKAGHYYTQGVLPARWAIGRGELDIDGNYWTYSSKEEDKGKITYYKTTNLFMGTNRIHFEVSESSDGHDGNRHAINHRATKHRPTAAATGGASIKLIQLDITYVCGLPLRPDARPWHWPGGRSTGSSHR